MRTQVKIVTPSEHWALRARPGECAAPRHVDVVDARANMRTVHLQAKGRVPQEVRRWLSTILREAEAHLRSGGPLRLTRAGAHAKRNRHGAVPIKRDTRRPRGNETRPPGVPLPSLACPSMSTCLAWSRRLRPPRERRGRAERRARPSLHVLSYWSRTASC